MKKIPYIYTIPVALVFIALAVVLVALPRPKVSKLEKRELTEFPQFSWESLASGDFTDSVSIWFSDSEPYRDEFMTMSMWLKQQLTLQLPTQEEQIVFHPSDEPQGEEEEDEGRDKPQDRVVDEYQNQLTIDENAKICNAGIIVIGKVPTVRALMAYGGTASGGVGYADAANKYKEVFGDAVRVYCMVIPTSTEYYCPEQAKSATHQQYGTINNIFAHLRPDVHAVDVYSTLGEHASEDIYLRTDHHWAPLGAYYAAKKFAQVAKVPFNDLSHYEQRVVHGYVGSMYGYSKDISVKNSPEDFVYYVPKGVTYTTEYLTYKIDKNYKVVSASNGFTKGQFFHHMKDGSGAAYCTFMGGDTKITRIRTSTKNGRRLIILKDSFGNALPGYLFFSFEEIHVIDSRYFTKNMKAYVRDNQITDILFANNIFKAYSAASYNNYMRFLTQNGEKDFKTSSDTLGGDVKASKKTSEASHAKEAGQTLKTTETTQTTDSL